MRILAFVLAFTWTLFFTAYRAPCPPKLEIGQTYAEAKAVCPDIEGRARWADSTTASYLCPSKSVIVVGSKHTGRMVGFFLWTGD